MTESGNSSDTQVYQSSDPEQEPSSPLKGESLNSAIRKQTELLLSRENLTKDTLIVSEMDSQMGLPLKVLAGLKPIKQLTTDMDVLVAALSTSVTVTLDATHTTIKPNLKLERNTLIFREISADTPEEDLRSIFQAEQCPTPKTLRSDINDTWFVVFANEADCMGALEHIMGKEFQGKPLKVRVKSESLMSILQPAVNRREGRASDSYSAGAGHYQSRYYSQNSAEAAYATNPYPNPSPRASYDTQAVWVAPQYNAQRNSRNNSQSQPRNSKGGRRRDNQGQGQSHTPAEPKDKTTHAKPQEEAPGLGNVNFPPLVPQTSPPKSSTAKSRKPEVDTSSGYSVAFKKYTYSDAVALLRSMPLLEKPKSMAALSEVPVVLASANTRLENTCWQQRPPMTVARRGQAGAKPPSSSKLEAGA